MTDWLAWALVLMVGVFTTLGLALRALSRTPVAERPDLRTARRSLVATIVASFFVYALYLAFGEDRVWYF